MEGQWREWPGIGARDVQEDGRQGKKFWFRSECSGEPEKDSEQGVDMV